MNWMRGLGEERLEVGRAYRQRGGDLDRYEASLACHALTAVEDQLELARGARAAEARGRVSALRRRLEAELR